MTFIDLHIAKPLECLNDHTEPNAKHRRYKGYFSSPILRARLSSRKSALHFEPYGLNHFCGFGGFWLLGCNSKLSYAAQSGARSKRGGENVGRVILTSHLKTR